MAIYIPAVTLGVAAAGAQLIKNTKTKNIPTYFKDLSHLMKNRVFGIDAYASWEPIEQRSIRILGGFLSIALGTTALVALATYSAF